jgi:hypothetical protein
MNLLHAVATADLIAELIRRKRLHVIEALSIHFAAYTRDEGYMHAINAEMTRDIARELDNTLCITFEDTHLERDPEDRPIKTMRKASLTVLVPEGMDDDSDEDH